MIKQIVKCWNNSVNGNIYFRISALEERLSEADDLNHPHEEVAILKMELEELLLEKISMLRQKARISWLKEGDRNSKFFHQSILRRRAHNRIQELSWRGELLKDRCYKVSFS